MRALRVGIGSVGLIAWVVIIIASVERECAELSALGTFCLEDGDRTFNYLKAGMLSAVLMAGVISAYVLSHGVLTQEDLKRAGLD